jgi:NitT/TauT family transport system permease protein
LGQKNNGSAFMGPFRRGTHIPPIYLTASILALLALWKIASLFVGQEIILPAPERTFEEFFRLVVSDGFRADLLATVSRGVAGFLISLAAGLAVGSLAGTFRAFGVLMAPLLAVVRATPVMSVILLALIWFTSGTVPVFVAFLMAFPVVTTNVMEGFRSTDPRLLSMARSFRVSRARAFFEIRLPSLFPYLAAGANAALGLTWKVVVAAEVLSQPIHAIGTGLQDAKIDLDTAEVFAWTMAAVLLSAVSETLFRIVIRFSKRRV